MVTSNNDNINKGFLSEQIREDNMKVNVKQSNQKNNNNDNECYLSEQYNNTNMEAYEEEAKKKNPEI